MSDNCITHKELNAAILEAKDHAKDNMRHQINHFKDDLEAANKAITDCHKRMDNLMMLCIAGLIGFVISIFVVMLT